MVEPWEQWRDRWAALIGAGLMLGKTLVIVVGLQTISYAAHMDDARRARRIKVVGMALAMLLGPIIEVSAYAFAPQALLAPLNGFDVVWNILLAPCTLGEEQTPAKIVGTVIVFLGSSIAPIAGPHEVTADDLESLRSNFISVRFAVYVLTFLAAFLVGFVLLKKRKHSGDYPFGKDVVRGVLIGLGGGSVAGQTYFLSSSATLVHANIAEGDWSAWSDWLPYAIVTGAVTCALLNAVLMNKGLAEFEAIFFVPMFAGSAIVAACVSAVVVLRETTKLPYVRMAAYWAGVSLVVCGLGVLGWEARKASASPSRETSGDDEEIFSVTSSTSTDSMRQAAVEEVDASPKTAGI